MTPGQFAIRPKFTNLDPVKGVKRMFSTRGFVELIKAILKIVLVTVVAWGYLKSNLPQIIEAETYDPSAYVPFFGMHAFRLGMGLLGAPCSSDSRLCIPGISV